MLSFGMITQNLLKTFLKYDPETGSFIWVERPAQCVHVGDIAGYINSIGYHSIKIYKISYMSHRLAFLYMTGRFPEIVDHINGVRSDNRWCNLRESSQRENQCNRIEHRKDSCKVPGVFYDSRQKKNPWAAHAAVNGKQNYLGSYATQQEAIMIRHKFLLENDPKYKGGL